MTHTQINHFTQAAAFDRGYHLMCLCLDSFHNPRDNKTLDTDDGREWKMFFLLVHDLMFLHVFFCCFFLTSKCTGRIGCWINLSGGKKNIELFKHCLQLICSFGHSIAQTNTHTARMVIFWTLTNRSQDSQTLTVTKLGFTLGSLLWSDCVSLCQCC